MLEQVTLDDGSTMAVPGIVPKLSLTPGGHRRNAPTLGQDTTPCCARSGSPTPDRALRERGVVAEEPAMTRIHFNEVVTRDGFQIEPGLRAHRRQGGAGRRAVECGFAKIEVTSFTSPKAIPMLRDAEEVMGRIRRVPGVEYTVLVPNVRGAERALESKADELNVVMSTSETHNLANLRMPRERSFAGLRDVIALAAGKVPVNVSLSTCFGCPMEGEVPQDEVLRWAGRFADLGVRGLTICDTTGMAHPAQVAEMVRALRDRFAGCNSRCTSTTRAAWGWPTCWRPCRAASTASTARWAAWAAARTRRAPAATSAARTRSTCWRPWATTPASTCRACWTSRAGLPQLLGHDVPGQVAKAGRITDLHAPPPYVAELRAASA
jgi:hydroxymethylglutaryl-CoA lyase